MRYPDLPAPTQDELTAKIRLFEAVARLFDALAQLAPLVLLLDDLHWMDGASLDLLRYLGHYWSRQRSRVLLLGTVRSEGLELNGELAAELCDLGRDLPVSQVILQPLSSTELATAAPLTTSVTWKRSSGADPLAWALPTKRDASN